MSEPEATLGADRPTEEPPTEEGAAAAESTESARAPARPAGPPPEIRVDHRVIALGKTGSGKSELVAYLWARSRRQRLLIDVSDHYELGPEAIAEGAQEIEQVKDLDWRVRTIRFVPRRQRDYDDLYAAIFERRNLDVWLDEAFGPTTEHTAPEHLRLVVTQGRKRQIRHMATSQRPAKIMGELVDQAEHAFLFPQTNRDDLMRLRYRTGVDAGQLSRMLDELERVDGLEASGYYRHTIGYPQLIRMPPLPAHLIAGTRRHIINPA